MNVLSEQAHSALDALVNGITHLTAVEKEQNEKKRISAPSINFIITADFRSYTPEKFRCNARVYEVSAFDYYHKDFDLLKVTKEEVEQIIADVEAELKTDHRVRKIELLKEKLAQAEAELAES